MIIYNTYQEAKIANPNSRILTTDHDWRGSSKIVGKFTIYDIGMPIISSRSWKFCHPADYCMTLEKFLADGCKLVDGDIFINQYEEVVKVGRQYQMVPLEPKEANTSHPNDNKCYILRAKALQQIETPEEKEAFDAMTKNNETVELTKEDSPQGVISRIGNRLYNKGCGYQGSELGEELIGMACEMWKILNLISNESITSNSRPLDELDALMSPESLAQAKHRAKGLVGKSEYIKGKYVKVTESIFELEDEFKRGELYCGHDGSYVSISVDNYLADCYSQGKVYRKVIIELTDRELFIHRCKEIWGSDVIPRSLTVIFGKIYDELIQD
jgi:hypothetical protein